MASPKIEVLVFYDQVTGVPLTGAVPSFITYKDSSGGNVSQPSISEIGGGAYKFTPVFSDPTKGIVFVVNGGANASPRHQSRFMRPEDWNTDDIPVGLSGSFASLSASIDFVTKINYGRWKNDSLTSTMTFYDSDGSTPIVTFDLKDANGLPSVSPVFERIPQ